MPTRLSGGRVTTPEGCPGNPQRERLEEEEEEEGLFKADAVNEEPRARPRYPGVEDLFRRATFLRETHPYPSMLLYCQVK